MATWTMSIASVSAQRTCFLIQTGFFVVIDNGRQGGIRMPPREGVEPADRGRAILGERDAAFWGDVVDHVQLVCRLGDNALVAWARGQCTWHT